MRDEIKATRSRNLVWSERRGHLLGGESHRVDWNPALDHLLKTTTEVDSWVSAALALAASTHESEDHGQVRLLETAITRSGLTLRVVALYLAGIRSAQYALHDAPRFVVGGLGIIERLNALYAKLESLRTEVDPARSIPEVDAAIGATTVYVDAYFQGVQSGAELGETAQVISMAATARLMAEVAAGGEGLSLAIAGAASGAGAAVIAASIQGIVRGLVVATAAGTITFQKSGGAGPVNAGKEAELRVGISGPKVRIPSANGTAQFRVPDRVTELTVEEVKSSLKVSRTRQLEDYLEFRRQTGRTMVLWIRPTTRVAASLSRYIDGGLLGIAFIP